MRLIYRDMGKENGNYYIVIQGLYRKEDGDYYTGVTYGGLGLDATCCVGFPT